MSATPTMPSADHPADIATLLRARIANLEVQKQNAFATYHQAEGALRLARHLLDEESSSREATLVEQAALAESTAPAVDQQATS
jgi:hypothetical protein